MTPSDARRVRSPARAGAGDSSGSAAADVSAPVGFELRILRAFRRIIRAIDIHSRKLSSDHAITTPQLVTLTAIADGDPMSTSEVARRVHLSPSTVVGILDRLETKKLVRRERSTKDRRVVFVHATAKGRSLVTEAPSPLQDRLAAALRSLPEAEQLDIAGALEKVVTLMEAREIDASPILDTGPILQDPKAAPKGSPENGR